MVSTKIVMHLALFCRFLDVMDAADVPDDCTQAFSCQYFLALHKDSHDDKKLCRIGIGTHVRRILGALEAFAYAAEFAALLWPFQFGIALASGMQFLVHAFHAAIT